jgi:hypothetical protein
LRCLRTRAQPELRDDSSNTVSNDFGRTHEKDLVVKGGVEPPT